MGEAPWRNVVRDPSQDAAPTAADGATHNAADAAVGRRPVMPWREAVAPHPDVADGSYLRAEFAVDLGGVAAGTAAAAYQDPAEFFRRTHVTAGLRGLLAAAIARLDGRGGEPVVLLRTSFGAGKTHALLALYHLLRCGGAAAGLPVGDDGLRRAAGAAGRPPARTAVLVGTDLGPTAPWPCRALGGRPVRTLWGELAAQLGGAGAYARLQRCDEAAVPPSVPDLADLLAAHSPSLVLADEMVPFVRALFEGRGLPAGSFDANLTFVHNLTEAAARSPGALVVLTLPSSEVELGGPGGRAAAERIMATLHRVDTPLSPTSARDGVGIVRRRLFGPLRDEAAREAACRAFQRMYAQGGAAFPDETRDGEYAQRLREAYPVHPEVFGRLYDDWAALDGFQGTRGVLRLLAAAVHELWRQGDAGAVVLPGSLPLGAPPVRAELLRCLDPGWDAVLDADVDGEGSVPAAVERSDPRLARHAAARRVARTLLLGSAPRGRSRQAAGLEGARIRLGSVQAGEPVAAFDDALARLRQRLAHLHGDGGRLWYATRPNLNRTAADRAEQVETWEVEREVRRRLAARERGDFAAVHVSEPDRDVPDEAAVRLVVLPPGHPHRGGAASEPSPAVALAAELLERRGTRPRRFRNALVFAAADAGAAEDLDRAARRHLAWRSVADDAAAGRLDLDPFQRRTARDGARTADAALAQQVREAYRWLLVPVQDGAGPVGWQAIPMPGDDPLAVRAARRLRADDLLIARWSPELLRRELDRWLWRDRAHVGLREVWEALATYCYLPRLRGPDVLLAAVADGLAAGGHLGYADGVDAAGRYVGLRWDGAAGALPLDPAAVLVKPGPDAERPSGGAAGVRCGEGDAAAGAARAPTRETAAVSASSAGTAAPAPPVGGVGGTRGFRGSVALDPARAASDVSRVVEEVLRHLAGVEGARLRLRLDIAAAAAGGAGLPPDVVRTVGENCRALGFDVAEFEEGDARG